MDRRSDPKCSGRGAIRRSAERRTTAPDLDKGYDPLWWVKNLIQRENISSLPPSLEIKRKVQRELETIWHLRREEDVRAKVGALNAEISRINRNAISGPPTTQTLLDLEAIVQQWRERNQQC